MLYRAIYKIKAACFLRAIIMIFLFLLASTVLKLMLADGCINPQLKKPVSCSFSDKLDRFGASLY